jgi:hypothetical protein
MDNKFLEHMTLLFYTSYEFAQLESAPNYLKYIETSGAPVNTTEKLQVWDNLDYNEKEIWREKTKIWLNDYKDKFPGFLEYVENNWLAVDWTV